MDNLRDQLKRDEGTRLKPYRDQVGKLTIGTGRNLDAEGISMDENNLMLDNDIRKFTAEVLQYLPWTANLDLIRRAALVNMTFNMGIEGLLGFKHMLECVQAHQFSDAADAMRNSKWADEVGPRAARLAIQMETGEWQ